MHVRWIDRTDQGDTVFWWEHLEFTKRVSFITDERCSPQGATTMRDDNNDIISCSNRNSSTVDLMSRSHNTRSQSVVERVAVNEYGLIDLEALQPC